LNRNVVILGAGGHARVVADVINANNDHVIGFLDDDPEKDVLGKIDEYINFSKAEFAIGVGSVELRKKFSEYKVKWYTGVHPSSVVSPSAIIGVGTIVMPHVTVNANAQVGNFCILNSGAIIEHDNIVKNYSHISVGARLGGNVCIEEEVWVGIGATVKNNLSICSGTIIGAGAVVVKDIETTGVYVGVPAKILIGSE
jgi:sugar O-acyltransferase (sialic acid O-acetyltransferase NeuD family)